MKILCVGSNYAKHTKEMGGQTPTTPVWFWKPPSAIIASGQNIVIPPGIGAVHHEVELAIRMGADGPDAITVAIDVTARDLQTKAKAEGKPWTQAKGYDTFLPLGPWVPLAEPGNQRLRLFVDGVVRQDASTAGMTWAVPALLAAAAEWTTLEPGDILLTGTPEGVGPLQPGQTVRAELVGHAFLEVGVETRAIRSNNR